MTLSGRAMNESLSRKFQCYENQLTTVIGTKCLLVCSDLTISLLLSKMEL